MTERTARVRVVADTSAYQKSMQAAAGSTDTLIKKAGGLDAIGGKMQALGGSMTRALTLPLGAAVGLAVKSASDLQQAVGGTEAVFGDAADAINDYAKTAASASGLSEREFREATTSIGGQLKRMTGDVDLAAEQSMKLTGVAADLAATYGGTTADAVAALGSAFRGEADPAERFNLNLKIGAVNAKAVAMGLAESTTTVDDNARAQATLALIMEQSADATGQFARESDSAAGSMQIAKAEMENASAEIGNALLPLVADLAGGVADLAGSFSKLPDPVQNGILAIAGLMAAAGPLMSVGGRLVAGWSKVGPAFDKVSTGAFTASGHLGKFGAAVGALALAGVVFELSSMAKELTTVNTEVERLNGLADDELGETLEKMLTRAWTGHAGNPAEAAKDFADEIERIARESPAAAESLLRIAESADGGMADAMERAGVTTDGMRAAMDRGIDAASRSAEANKRNAEVIDETTGATETNTDAVDEAVEAQEKLEKAIKDVTDAMRSQLDPLFAAQDAFAEHRDLQDEMKWANLDLTDSGEDLAEAIKTHGRESDEAAAAWHRQLEAQKKVDELNDKVVRSALDVATASVELKARVDDGSVSLEAAEAQLRDWVTQGLITADQAWQTAEQLRGTAGAADSLSGINIVIPVSANTTAFEMQMAALYRERDGIRISVGGGGGIPIMDVGGVIPGGRNAPVPMVGHGGEGVLPVAVMDALRNGNPMAASSFFGFGAVGPSTTDNSRSIVQNFNYPKPEPASDGIARAMRRAQYVL